MICILEPGLEKSEKRGVRAARNSPSPPPCVARPEMSTADRLGPRERAEGVTHFVAPTSACTRSTCTSTGRAFGRDKGRSLYPKGLAQTMVLPQAVAAFRVQALERSRFAVGRLPAAYGDWSARPLACRSEVNGVKWLWNCLAELTTRPVSAPRPSIAVALDDRAAVGTRDFPSSPPMGDSFWLGL